MVPLNRKQTLVSQKTLGLAERSCEKQEKKMHTVSKTGSQNVLVGHNSQPWQETRSTCGLGGADIMASGVTVRVTVYHIVTDFGMMSMVRGQLWAQRHLPRREGRKKGKGCDHSQGS